MARHSIPDIIDQADLRPGELRTTAEVSVVSGLVRSLRPYQWTKNLIIFGGLLFGQRLFDLRSVLDASAAFVVFCALSGVVYLANDVADRDFDRHVQRTANRPVTPPPAARTMSARGTLSTPVVSPGPSPPSPRSSTPCATPTAALHPPVISSSAFASRTRRRTSSSTSSRRRRRSTTRTRCSSVDCRWRRRPSGSSSCRTRWPT